MTWDQGRWYCRTGCRVFRVEYDDGRQRLECSVCRAPVYLGAGRPEVEDQRRTAAALRAATQASET
jgi:hypothetical protein